MRSVIFHRPASLFPASKGRSRYLWDGAGISANFLPSASGDNRFNPAREKRFNNAAKVPSAGLIVRGRCIERRAWVRGAEK